MLGFFRGFNPRLPGRSSSSRRYRDGCVEGIRRSHFARRFPSYSSSISRPRPSECDDRFVRPPRPGFSQQPGMEQSTVSDKDDSRPQQPSFRPQRPGQQRPCRPQRPGQQGPCRPQRPGQQGPCRPQRPGQQGPCRPQRPGQQRPRPQQRPEQQRPRPQQRPEQQRPTLGQTVLTQQQAQTVPQEPAVCVEPPVPVPEVCVEPPVPEPEVCVEPPVPEPEVCLEPPVPEPEVCVEPPVPEPEVCVEPGPEPGPEPEVCEPEVSEELEEPEELEESDEYVEPVEPEEPEEPVEPVEPVVPEEPEIEEEELATKLHVTAVDLHYEDNAKEHHTDMYACAKGTEERDAELVLRRGQEFKMTITFDRPYDIKKNDITLMFNLGDEYKPHKGLNASFTVDETGATKYKPNNWGATVTGQEGNSLTLSVFIPATTPIGEWEFAIRTIVDVKDDKNIIWQYNHTADVIDIIFNPWCKEDWVYMEDDVWRTETVLNDHGTQYYGTYNQVGVKAWAYNQFNYGILDTALHLVRKSFGFQATPAMASPVKVSRMIAKIVNSPDDDGVLLGNWSGNYTGGVAPTAWVGSEKILLEYMKTAKPVRYGQCWVFSAVTTAVCRALGLPCRSITNFSSAHNTDLFRLSVDVIKRDVGGVIEETKDDSIWNFHVWNEVYMRRPDLNTDAIKYDGWQVIDATPQERSDGVYVCGPAPVVAIKEGHLNVGDDTSFVYAEVNADKVEWTNSNVLNTLVETKRNRYAIGKNISTHRPTGKPYAASSTGNFMTGDDNMEREDLTKFYKYEDGSAKEKSVYASAEKQFYLMNGKDSEASEPVTQTSNLDIEIDEMGDITVGSPFAYSLVVKNNRSDACTAKVNLKVLYKTYFDTVTGIAAEKDCGEIRLQPGASEKFMIGVTEDEANKRPQDEFNFELKATAICKEDARDNATNDLEFRMRKPDIQISGPATCSLSDTIQAELSFKNPLTVPLSGCSVSFAGGFDLVGIASDTLYFSTIAAGETWSKTFDLRPKEAPRGQAERALCVGFDSIELAGITGKYSTKLV